MEHEDLTLLDDSLNTTEQDHKVDEGDADMEVAPTDQLALVPEAIVQEVSLQEKVIVTGIKDTIDVEEENETAEEDDELDRQPK